jgi:chorismate synthase
VALAADAPFRCADPDVEQRMVEEVDRAREAGDTKGGGFEVIAAGVPVGLGSYVQWDRKLDGRIAQAMMSIPAIKAVGIGLGPEAARRPGSAVHDEIVPDGTGARATGLARPTNRAGGLEGGVTNGEDLRVSAWMKPISTLMKPLRSVDLTTMTESAAAIERSDVCAVPAAAVVGEAMLSLVLADALLEKYGGDSVAELESALEGWSSRLRLQFHQ